MILFDKLREKNKTIWIVRLPHLSIFQVKNKRDYIHAMTTRQGDRRSSITYGKDNDYDNESQLYSIP